MDIVKVVLALLAAMAYKPRYRKENRVVKVETARDFWRYVWRAVDTYRLLVVEQGVGEITVRKSGLSPKRVIVRGIVQPDEFTIRQMRIEEEVYVELPPPSRVQKARAELAELLNARSGELVWAVESLPETIRMPLLERFPNERALNEIGVEPAVARAIAEKFHNLHTRVAYHKRLRRKGGLGKEYGWPDDHRDPNANQRQKKRRELQLRRKAERKAKYNLLDAQNAIWECEEE